MLDPIYLDHNATTPLRPELRERYVDLLGAGLGNPSSLHGAGQQARALIDEARERAAAALGVHEDELTFTSGGTESDNLALLGASADARSGIACPPIEHAAVLETAMAIEQAGMPAATIAVDAAGRVELGAIEEVGRGGSVKVLSVGAANGEVGTVQPLAEIVETARGAGFEWCHTDAVQALGRIPLDLEGSGIDLAALSGHKIGAPVGVGLLYCRSGRHLPPRLHGGGQEHGLRPGTENVASIDAVARAIELAVSEREASSRHLAELTAELWAELRKRVDGLKLNGPTIDAADRLPNTLNVTVPEVDGRMLVTRLDLNGLRVSAGSACASGSAEPSHVLRALGRTDEEARASIRLSLGADNTRIDCQQAVDILVRTCARERASRASE